SNAPILGRLAELLHRRDAQLLVELADGFRAEPGNIEQLDEAGRNLGPQPFEHGHPARRHELADLVADRLADTADLGRIAGTIGGDEIDRTPADGIRCPVIGNRLERDLALDLEDVADLMKD